MYFASSILVARDFVTKRCTHTCSKLRRNDFDVLRFYSSFARRRSFDWRFALSVHIRRGSFRTTSQLFDSLINRRKLQIEARVLQKRTQIKPVVVRRVVFCVVRRSKRRHLVSGDRVVKVKVFDFLSNFLITGLRSRGTHRPVRRTNSPPVGPTVTKLDKGRKRAAVFNLAAKPEIAQFLVRHAHILFVKLRPFCSSELGTRLGIGNALQHCDALVLRSPYHKRLEIAFIDPPNRVDVRSRAIVFSVISPQRLVDICRAKYEQRAACCRLISVGCPRH
mmetsp:Transcript_6120/g.10274  ORF Transcript_6120/g.10274 Transcript_6120/m.10274 type:complete len:278 (-) Transcript_6120:1599-2432(-)